MNIIPKEKHNVKWSDVVTDLREVQKWASSVESVLKTNGPKSPRDAIKISELMKGAEGTLAGSALYNWMQFNYPLSQRHYLFEVEGDLVSSLMAMLHSEIDLSRARKQLSGFKSAINTMVSGAGSAKYTYKGFRIENPHRMTEFWLVRLHDAIDHMLDLFKKRGVDKLLQDNINVVYVAPKGHGNYAGQYFSRDQKISVFGSGLLNLKGRFLKSWVHEVFIHEFGHYVHLNHLTKDSKEFWDSAWSYADAAVDSLQEAKRTFQELTPSDRGWFYDELRMRDFNAVTVARKLAKNPVDRVKFMYWLKLAGYLNQMRQVRLNKEGKEAMEYLRDHKKPEYLERWIDNRLGHNWREQIREHHRKFPDYFEGGPELRISRAYESAVETFNGKRASIDRRLHLLGLMKGVPDTVPSEHLQDAIEVHQKVRDLTKERQDQLKGLGIPTGYGHTNVKEDFAETFVGFMTNPRGLSDIAQYRMSRTLWLSGYGGKPVMRLSRTAPLPDSSHNVDWDSVTSDLKGMARSYTRARKAIKARRAGGPWEAPKIHYPSSLRYWLEFNFHEGPEHVEIQKLLIEINGLDLPFGLGKSRLDELEQKMKRVEDLIRGALPKAGTAKYAYKGFRIQNPHRVIEPLLAQVHDGIDYMLSIFKKRNVEQLLLESLPVIKVIPTSGGWGSAAGSYRPRDKELSIYGLAFRDRSGRMLKNWVHEVLIHEVGHHAHLNFITSEAMKYWNSGWSHIDAVANVLDETAKSLLQEPIMLSQGDRNRFWNLLEANGFNPTRASKKLNKDLIDRTRFLYWLYMADFTKQIAKPSLTLDGKAAIKLLQGLSDPSKMEIWVKEMLKNSRDARYLERARKRWMKEDEYQRKMQELRVNLNPEKELQSIRKSLRLDDGRDFEVSKSMIQEAVMKMKVYKDHLKNKEKQTEALGVPTDYGKTNVKEDFAETFVLWVRNPRRLSDVAQYRMARTMWLSGYGGKPVMRLATPLTTRLASRHIIARGQVFLQEVGTLFKTLRQYERFSSEDWIRQVGEQSFPQKLHDQMSHGIQLLSWGSDFYAWAGTNTRALKLMRGLTKELRSLGHVVLKIRDAIQWGQPTGEAVAVDAVDIASDADVVARRLQREIKK